MGALAISPDGQVFIVGVDDGTVCMGRIAEPEKVTTRFTYPEVVTGVCFSPDGKFLASGSQDGTLSLTECSTLGLP